MDILVMNKSFSVIDVIDSYESLLWVDRYQEPGEFELYTPITDSLLKNCVKGYYLSIRESDHVMIIEDIRIETSVEAGAHIRVTGRSLESILDRRIVWKMTNINSYLQTGVKRILNENVINPEISGRRISNFIIKDSTDPKITTLRLNKQCTGTNLLEFMKELCLDNDIGFKITLNDSNQFVFELYAGVDRSYDQVTYPYVCFSPSVDNIINTNYADIVSEMKNVTLVAGEGEGSDRKTVTVGTATGLDRLELYTDARDIQSDEYTEQLVEDTEILNSYKDKLTEDQNLLTEERAAAQADASEYATKAQAHQTLISQYTARIDNVFTRLANENAAQRTVYIASLPAEKQAIIANIDTYQANEDQYQALINESNSKISSYNDHLKNDLDLTYAQAVYYQNLIEQEEAVKATNESNKSYWSKMKTDEKALLSDEENATLDKYTNMETKYSDIASDDTKKRTDEQTAATKDQTEYQEKQTAHNQLINQYTSDIANDNSMITTYEAIVAEDQRTFNELYNSLLVQRGEEKLAECTEDKSFDGRVDSSQMYVFGEDFFMGDVVQIENEYQIEGTARVVEFIWSQSTSGLEEYPTFRALEEE